MESDGLCHSRWKMFSKDLLTQLLVAHIFPLFGHILGPVMQQMAYIMKQGRNSLFNAGSTFGCEISGLQAVLKHSNWLPKIGSAPSRFKYLNHFFR